LTAPAVSSTVRIAASVLAAALLAACTGGPGHPVRLSLPRLAADAAPPTASAEGEPAAPAASEAAASLFRGLEGVLRPLETLHARPVSASRRPLIAALPRMEAAVQARYRGGGYGGAVRHAIVVAATGRVPLTPAEAARLWMDADAERRVLGADTFRVLGSVYALPNARRTRYLVEMRRMGSGPVRFDLRFGLAAERWDLADGRVLIRTDPFPDVGPRHVTLYRGGCLIAPVEGGSRLTEIVILGADIRVPFFLDDELRQLTRNKLTQRVAGLWERAWAGR
jgi:hypothetical protein